MKQAVWQAVVIAILAGCAAGASYLFRPDALPMNVDAHEVTLDEALAMGSVFWVDARVEADFVAAHFEGAVNVNEENWEEGFVSLLDKWAPELPIVVYCSSQSCLRSHEVAKRLREELGTEDAFSLRDGWEALQQAGLVKGAQH